MQLPPPREWERGWGCGWVSALRCCVHGACGPSGSVNVSVCARARGACKASVCPPHAPPLAYTLILFDRVVTPAPPGRPEMKSIPPAKPLGGALCREAPLGGGGAAVPEVPRSVLRARRSEVMN